MYWSKRSNAWSFIVFIMVIVGALVRFLFAFAFQDVGKHIAMAFIFLLGGIILLVVPAYFIGMLVDKLKKENSNISQHKRQAPLRDIEPDIADPTKHNILIAENIMSDKKQENEMVKKVSSDKIITKPVVEPKTINLHYGDTLPSDQINVSDNLISKSKNLKPLVTTDSDAFYAQAWDEINDQKKEPVKALWARSFADAQGDEKKAQAKYIELRVQQLLFEQNQHKAEIEKQKERLIVEERRKEKLRRAAYECETYISSLKTNVTRNWLNNITGHELLKKYREAQSIDEKYDHQDTEFENTINAMLEEIKKRGLPVDDR